MKPSVCLLAALAIAAAPRVAGAASPAAQDAVVAPPAPSLQLRPKAVMPTPAKSHTFAPFIAPQPEPELDLLPRIDPRAEESRSSCQRASTLCYDPASRRIVYKPARALMPELPGLQRENISLKRDRITFKYSF